MAVPRCVLLASLLFMVFAISCWQIQGKHLKHKKRHDVVSSNKKLMDETGAKKAIGAFIGGARGLFDLALSIAGTVQGFVCTFESDVCSKDETLERVIKMEKMLDEIQKDIKTIKDDVLDIWKMSYTKWYFDHIKNNVKLRTRVLGYIKDGIDNSRTNDQIQTFIHEVLGTGGKDEYIEKALEHIPGLVVDELITKIMETRLDRGDSPVDAAKATWKFIRKVFLFQEDGYISVLIAASLKYKQNETFSDEVNKKNKEAFDLVLAQVCTWWPKAETAEKCAQFKKPANIDNQRKLQQDFILSRKELIHLALVPALRTSKNCSNFNKADGLLFMEGFLYVAQPEAKNVLIVKTDEMKIIKTLEFGDNKPFSVAIEKDRKLMAVAIRQGSKGKLIKMYKISGDLQNPEGISIEHYYDVKTELLPVGSNDVDIKAVSFCGRRIAYADYHGAIRNYGLSNDEPNVFDRADWYTYRPQNIIRGNMNYLSCSNNGQEWLVQRTSDGTSADEGVGAIQTNIRDNMKVILDGADAVVKRPVWYGIGDGQSRMGYLKGMAMDSSRRYLYSSEQLNLGNSVAGIYKRTCDGGRHFIQEWEHVVHYRRVQMFGMAMDDDGFVYSVQQDDPSVDTKCLVKYHHAMEFEDIPIENIQ